MRIVPCFFYAILIAVGVSTRVQAQQPWQMTEPCADEAASGRLVDRWIAYWKNVDLQRARVNAWPAPFVIPDRQLVRTPFKMMADNGWKLQTTLSDHLFETEDNELTYAGKLKLRWILTQIPPHRRQIYVMEGRTGEETGTRVASVYKNLADIAPGGVPCPVLVTQIAPRGGDGAYLNNIDQLYKEGVPVPRLSGGDATSGGAAANASGGGP